MKKLLLFICMLLQYSIQGQNLLENLSLTENNMGSMNSAIKTFIESLPATARRPSICFSSRQEKENTKSLKNIQRW